MQRHLRDGLPSLRDTPRPGSCAVAPARREKTIDRGMTSRARRAGRPGGRTSRQRTSGQRTSLAAAIALAIGALVAGSSLVIAQTAQDPSDVVLVFDVSNSILDSDDGTNTEFAAALDGIADRVGVIADDLATGNATVSFVVFGRTAKPYPAGCQRIELQGDPAAVARFEECLRKISAEYAAGSAAPVKDRINTAGTDHVAALVDAAGLLPDVTSRSAVIFFTDGQHDPPGTGREGENVVAEVTPAFAGRTPLAILPVGLGRRAGRFEDDLGALYANFLRDMAPCAGRAAFSWPEVVFASGSEAGSAVALALQEVTCSFTVAPTAPPSPTPTAPPGDAPLGVRVLAGNESLTIQWQAPTSGKVTDYLVRCRPTGASDWIDSGEGVSTDTQTVIEGLEPGVAYDCEVAATNGKTTTAYAPAAASTIVLGIPAALGQPRVEPLDAAARLSVDPVGGIPVERYVFECTGAAGQPVEGSGPGPSVVVSGLANGEAFQCVAYAENRIGRSTASPASASFTPCGGLFGCNPWLLPVVVGVGLVALVAAGLFLGRRYAERRRIWVTAQVDGGANRSLGWGREHGIGLEEDDAGWYARPRPIQSAPIRIQYDGKNRFVVHSPAGVRNVHQGDPAPVREGTGPIHQLTVRLYRKEPREAIATPPPPPDDASVNALGARLDGANPEG
jgi:hypothetical protein